MTEEHQSKTEQNPEIIKSMYLAFSDGECLRACYLKQEQEWSFAILDIVALITQSKDPRQYCKKMRYRSRELDLHWDEWTKKRSMGVSRGSRYLMRSTDWRGMIEILRAIPGRPSKPYQKWLEEEGLPLFERADHPDELLLYSILVLLEVLHPERELEYVLIEELDECTGDIRNINKCVKRGI